MSERYLIDTSIWIDLVEDRIGYNQEPLGDYALKLFSTIKTKKNKIIISELLVNELKSNYTIENINGMFLPFKEIIETVQITKEQYT